MKFTSKYLTMRSALKFWVISLITTCWLSCYRQEKPPRNGDIQNVGLTKDTQRKTLIFKHFFENRRDTVIVMADKDSIYMQVMSKFGHSFESLPNFGGVEPEATYGLFSERSLSKGRNTISFEEDYIIFTVSSITGAGLFFLKFDGKVGWYFMDVLNETGNSMKGLLVRGPVVILPHESRTFLSIDYPCHALDGSIMVQEFRIYDNEVKYKRKFKFPNGCNLSNEQQLKKAIKYRKTGK